jgi:hypothetical protein
VTREDASGWLKKNAAAVVTWALVVLAGAVAWGITRSEISTASEKVTELRTDSREAKAERSALISDVRVVETKLSTLADAVSRSVSAVDRLEHSVTRLEALASGMARIPR